MAGTTRREKMVLEIPPIDIQYITMKIVGTSSLIVHKWDEKIKREILEKQQKKAKAKTYGIRNPTREFVNSIYWLSGAPDIEGIDDEDEIMELFENAVNGGAEFGFPSVALKDASVAAGFRSGITKDKVSMYAAFHIDAEFIKIAGEPPAMREDMVRVGMGSADLRYRGEFKTWESEVTFKYNAGAISPEQLANLVSLGGFACGIGEWRPEKGGTHGMYEIA